MTGLKIANENDGIYLLLPAQAGVSTLQFINAHYPSKKL